MNSGKNNTNTNGNANANPNANVALPHRRSGAPPTNPSTPTPSAWASIAARPMETATNTPSSSQAPGPTQTYASISSSRPTQSSTPNPTTSKLSLSSKFDNLTIRTPNRASSSKENSAPLSTGNTTMTPIPPTEKPEKDDKLTFFSDEYATVAETGSIGPTFPVRVNRLQMCQKGLPQLRQYRITFPQLNDREVTKKAVKKQMITQTLQAINVHKNPLVSTDWNDLLITQDQSLAALANDQLKLRTDDSYLVNINFMGQNLAAQAQPCTITIRPENEALDKADFAEYLRGNKPANFNYGPYATALNVRTRHFAAQKATCIGSNRVFPLDSPDGQRDSLGRCGLHPRLGFYCSVRPSQGGVQLQINPSASAFFNAVDLVDFFKMYIGPTKFDPANPNLGALREAQVATQKLQVRLKYIPQDPKIDPKQRSQILPDKQIESQGRLKRICAYGFPANAQMFSHSFYNSPAEWSVQDYFQQKVLASETINYPGLPVVNVGTYDKPIWVPMELLRIEAHHNLKCPMRDTDMGNMAKFARREPLGNVTRIETAGLRLLDRVTLSQRDIVQVDTSLMEVRGRMLKVPSLRYKDVSYNDVESSEQDRTAMSTGKWRLINKTFSLTTNLPALLVIQIGDEWINQAQAHALAKGLTKYGISSRGKRTVSLVVAPSPTRDDMNKAYGKLGKPEIKTILVILPDKNPDTYAQVKRWGEIIAGVNTVCLRAEKARSLTDPAFQANIATKFNVKVRGSDENQIYGGKNQVLGKDIREILHPSDKETMVVGADVTHPGPGSVAFCPSIAAVVASTDADCASFPGSMRLQASRQEDISDMQEMMLERLKLWFDKNNELPAHFLFYRDGVSEDQFAIVKRNELRKVRLACDQAAANHGIPDYKPKITLVVCTKRQQTRFFPPVKSKDAAEAETYLDRHKNFTPGFVVDDRKIRLPKYFDFWLQAHSALQGTARPCHYFVLENGMEFTPDSLQQLTFAMSFMYATSLTPVSLVAPAYYADKLCERGRCYIRPLLEGYQFARTHVDRLLSTLPRADTKTQKKATEDEKKDLVLKEYADKGGQGLWPKRDRNPCKDEVKDTMFYI